MLKDLQDTLSATNPFGINSHGPPFLTAKNKELINPLEFALTKNPPATPLECAVTKAEL
jgi:hypothetical protein